MERIKLRLKCDITGEIYFDETDAELAFEIKGYRFFYHDGRITDTICGMAIDEVLESETKKEFYNRVEQEISKRFDEYLKIIKTRPKAIWRRP
ncbi:hypothetical protein SMD22_00520 (plasmid) [Brevibacillus halotolerans]|nr:hypothetical protein SMD22_00520 [Brevibacillus halotolerans]